MNRFRNILNKTLEIICASIFIFMVLVATYQITTRYIFHKPSTISEDLLLFSFVWMALLSAAYVFGKREHMAMSFFSDKIVAKGPIYKKTLLFITEIIIMIFAVLILILGGIQISLLTMGQISPALQIPMGFLYLVLPISGILTFIYNILNIISILKSKE